MSRVICRVAALVAFFTTRPVADVEDFLDFLPVTLSDTNVPTIVASVAVMAVMMALNTLLKKPFFFFPPSFSSFLTRKPIFPYFSL